MPLALLSASFQSLPLLPTSKLGLSGAYSQLGGFVYVFRAPWVSPVSSPGMLGVSPAASTPTGVFSQRLEALFPCTGALGCAVCLTP